ncbi:MAG: response regulator transcription factor [Bacteroidota bacterium]
MPTTLINIMIVDDHQIIIDGIKSVLGDVKNMFVIAEANNGRDAIAILEKKTVDIILMDIAMPILNGCDATAIITARYPLIKVIALTTYDEKSIVKKMLGSGASGYVLKNINKEILIEAIDTVAKGEIYYSSEIPILLATSSAAPPITQKKQATYISLLSSREIEILQHIANGLSSNEIADKLFLSSKTIETHRTNIMRKLNIRNVVGLVKFALKSGLVE